MSVGQVGIKGETTIEHDVTVVNRRLYSRKEKVMAKEKKVNLKDFAKFLKKLGTAWVRKDLKAIIVPSIKELSLPEGWVATRVLNTGYQLVAKVDGSHLNWEEFSTLGLEVKAIKEEREEKEALQQALGHMGF